MDALIIIDYNRLIGRHSIKSYSVALAFRMPPSVSSFSPTPTAPPPEEDAAEAAVAAAAAPPPPPPGLAAAALAFTLLFT